MFGIGSTELAIILVFGFLLFGPDKLPQMGRTIGRALRQFRETQEKLTNVVQTEVVDPMTAAATAPTKSHKSTVDDDDDADIEEAEAPAHKETFAERRARLAAEKAAAEAADTEGAESAEDAPAAADEQPAEGDAAAEPAASEPEPSAEDEAAAEVKATADLYARRPRKRKAAAEDAEPAAEPAAEEAAEAAPAAPAESQEGGEQ